jgi:hypothetical protein
MFSARFANGRWRILRRQIWPKTLATCSLTIATSILFLAPLAEGAAQQRSLRQERAEAIEKFQKTGYCVGFFDISGRAGELLELSGTVPQAQARYFLQRVAAEGAAAKSQIPMLALLAGIAAQSDEYTQALSSSYANGVQQGKRDSEASSKASALTWHQTCSQMLQAVSPPAPPPATGTSSDQTPKQPVVREAPATARPLTADDIQAVRQKIRPCWNVFGGSREVPAVSMVVEMNPDGRVMKAEVKDTKRYDSDPSYRAAAAAAFRAITNARCQPWPLPRESYNQWRVMTLNFDPRDY